MLNRERRTALYTKVIIVSLLGVFGLWGDETSFNFSAEANLRLSYDEVNRESLLNRNNVKNLPYENFKLGLSVSCRRFFSKLGFACKFRGEFSYMSEFNTSKYEKMVKNGSSYLVADEFYIDALINRSIYAVIGKERVVIGNGMVFNPLDVINPKQYPDVPMTKEEGAIIAKLEFTPNDVFSAKLIYQPDLVGFDNRFDYKASALAAKTAVLIKSLDLSIFVYEKIKSNGEIESPLLAASANFMTPIYLGVYTDIGWKNGSDYTFFTNTGEKFYEKERFFPFALIGISYVLQRAVSLTAIVEYLRNGEGCSNENRRGFFRSIEAAYSSVDSARSAIERLEGNAGISSEEKAAERELLSSMVGRGFGQAMGISTYYTPYFLNRDYLALQIRIGEIFNRVDLRSLTVTALNDRSAVTSGYIDYKFVETFILSLAYSKVLAGNGYSQYGNLYKSHAAALIARFLF
ncbi:MAG: hypothetical protein GF344_16570 [Chitinivibrionales bacterium]|nr:hypothetical protein [Chitinivibrionales bacterium]